jgi:hypothetical protein
MRILLFICLFFSVSLLNSNSTRANVTEESGVVLVSDYEDGWEDGYCEGWKDVKGQFAICPIAPICPIPEIKCSEGYRCGYNRGFKAGMRAARN